MPPKKLYTLKVQVPLFSTDGEALPLVYDERRIHIVHQRLPPALLNQMKDLRLNKAYYVGEWNANLGIWLFIAPLKRVTTPQSW